MDIGKRIAQLRASCGLTQLELAIKAGVDPQHLSRIERGKSSPTFKTIEGLAAAFGMTVSDLSKAGNSSPPAA